MRGKRRGRGTTAAIDALLEYLDVDVVWHPPAESMEPGIYSGHDGVRDYVGRLGEMFEERHVEPLEVIDVDDEHVISVIRVIGADRALRGWRSPLTGRG